MRRALRRADLKNEPYSMFWGDPGLQTPVGTYPDSDRWDALARRLTDVLQATCPRWLVVVQGVGHCRKSGGSGECKWPSAPGHQNMKVNTWWGEVRRDCPPARPPCAAWHASHSPHSFAVHIRAESSKRGQLSGQEVDFSPGRREQGCLLAAHLRPRHPRPAALSRCQLSRQPACNLGPTVGSSGAQWGGPGARRGVWWPLQRRG